MPVEPFQFKQFAVAHDRCTHKVGTDGVLLGAWVRIFQHDMNMLDIGTGSGLIALMLAQRSTKAACIDAIDIEARDVRQAKENVLHSPWKEKVNVRLTSLQNFSGEKKYDLIVTNPPYFTNGPLPTEKNRRHARHARELPYHDLLHHALRLLEPTGRLALIFPYTERIPFLELAKKNSLVPLRITAFRSRAHKPVERLLMELAISGEKVPDGEIVLHSEGEKWSQDYLDLTRDFYLRT